MREILQGRAMGNALITKVNEELKDVKISTRYLIVEVSDCEESKTMGSNIGEYSVTFFNMYSFHLDRDKPGASGRHTTGWRFKAEDFDPSKVVIGKSYVEIVGTPQIGPYSRDFTYGMLGRGPTVGMSPRPMAIRVVTPAEGKSVRRSAAELLRLIHPSSLQLANTNRLEIENTLRIMRL